MFKRIVSLGLIGALLLSAMLFTAVSYTSAIRTLPPENTNSEKYWEERLGQTCIKYEADEDSPYGQLSDDGTGVILEPYNFDSATLIVKGGDVDNGDGPGNVVYYEPTAGEVYLTPLNAGEQQSEVSHWILCYSNEDDDDQPEPAVWIVSIAVTPENCELGAQLNYSHDGYGATLVGDSTAPGTYGPSSYVIGFVADENYYFDEETTSIYIEGVDGEGAINAEISEDGLTLTITGELAGPLDSTSEACILGEETPEEPVIPVIPQTPVTPDVLPNTSAVSPVTVISILAGMTAAIALAGATLRSLLYKGL